MTFWHFPTFGRWRKNADTVPQVWLRLLHLQHPGTFLGGAGRLPFPIRKVRVPQGQHPHLAQFAREPSPNAPR